MTTAPIPPVLHRLVPRNAIETTAFGYEVIARPVDVHDCVATVHWIDCWCPDAAQFILLEAPGNLASTNSGELLDVIGKSHLGQKMRLIMRRAAFRDDGLIHQLHEHGIGFLTGEDDAWQILEERTAMGILGVHCDAATAYFRHGAARTATRDLVREAHALGLRAVASQANPSVDVRGFFSVGFDYVSRADGGIVPMDMPAARSTAEESFATTERPTREFRPASFASRWRAGD